MADTCYCGTYALCRTTKALLPEHENQHFCFQSCIALYAERNRGDTTALRDPYFQVEDTP